jgi:hypothetical protein
MVIFVDILEHFLFYVNILFYIQEHYGNYKKAILGNTNIYFDTCEHLLGTRGIFRMQELF